MVSKMITTRAALSLLIFLVATASLPRSVNGQENNNEVEIIQLTSEQFYEMATTGDNKFAAILDVRTQQEWDDGHIPNATHVANIQNPNTPLPNVLMGCKHCPLVVYCGTGPRAQGGINRLVAEGFTGPLYNGLGAVSWSNAGYPLVTDQESVTPTCHTTNDNTETCSSKKEGMEEEDTQEEEDIPVEEEDPMEEEGPNDETTTPTTVAQIIDLTSTEFYEMKEAGEFGAVVDVRTLEEWEAGSIENSTLIENLQDAETPEELLALTSIDLVGCKHCPLVVYCRTGRRSGIALQKMAEAGFTGPLYNGFGITQWLDANYTLVSDQVSIEPDCKQTKEEGMEETCSNKKIMEDDNNSMGEQDSMGETTTAMDDSTTTTNDEEGSGNMSEETMTSLETSSDATTSASLSAMMVVGISIVSFFGLLC